MTFKQTLSSHRRARTNGFTLVELLVVIGIIAILAAVLLGVGNSAIKAAMRAKAQNYANQIQAAGTAYYTEYNTYPAPPVTPAADTLVVDTDTATWPQIIGALCGNKYPYDGTTYTATTTGVANTRSIQFLSLRATDVDNKNCPLNPLPTSGGGNYFNIAMDTDYDGALGTTGSAVVGKLPNIPKSTNTTMDYTGTATTGIAIWANCNGNASSKNPAFWIKTY